MSAHLSWLLIFHRQGRTGQHQRLQIQRKNKAPPEERGKEPSSQIEPCDDVSRATQTQHAAAGAQKASNVMETQGGGLEAHGRSRLSCDILIEHMEAHLMW